MTARMRAPGLTRGFLFFVIGVLFCAALVLVIRAAYGFPSFDGGLTGKAQNAILVVSLFGAPLFFLVGLGAFDYWFYWAAGRPTRPEDHSSHGAYSWRDYFRVNTDHKVIGIQYVVTSFAFMLIGGLLAMLVRAELAQPGMQFAGASSIATALNFLVTIITMRAPGMSFWRMPLLVWANFSTSMLVV